MNVWALIQIDTIYVFTKSVWYDVDVLTKSIWYDVDVLTKSVWYDVDVLLEQLIVVL